MEIHYQEEKHCGKCGRTPATLKLLPSTRTKWYRSETGWDCFRCRQAASKAAKVERMKLEAPEKHRQYLDDKKKAQKKRRAVISHTFKGHMENVFGACRAIVLRNPKNIWQLKMADVRTQKMILQYLPLFEAWRDSGWHPMKKPILTMWGYFTAKDRKAGILWHKSNVEWTTKELIRSAKTKNVEAPVEKPKRKALKREVNGGGWFGQPTQPFKVPKSMLTADERLLLEAGFEIPERW